MHNSKNKIIFSIKNMKLPIYGGKKFLISNLVHAFPNPCKHISTSLYIRIRVVSPSFQSREVQGYLLSQELFCVPLGYAGGYRTANCREENGRSGPHRMSEAKINNRRGIKGVLTSLQHRKYAFQYLKEKVTSIS